MVKPSEVKAYAQRLEEQNYKFRTFLKNHADNDELDAQFLALHNELFAGYDCCKCTNCCKVYSITLADDEVKKIAAFLGLAESDFTAEYLTSSDTGEEKPNKIKGKPCPFLCGDGRCRIQDCKPDLCKGFPFTDQPDRLSSMLSIIYHTEDCPVVFEIIERLKVQYRFRNRA